LLRNEEGQTASELARIEERKDVAEWLDSLKPQ
jgi:hypothetical protein